MATPVTFGDGFSDPNMQSSADNEMSMRFSGGYRFFTNYTLTAGVKLSPVAGSRSSVSDRRMKENFETSDNENILLKIAEMPVTKWNYKSQWAEQKHIGPMAQDFYKAFRPDGIDNDTTINSLDIDGVNMALQFKIMILKDLTHHYFDVYLFASETPHTV